MKFTVYNKDYKNQYKLNAWQHLLSILPCNLQVFKEYANFNQWFQLIAKHCKLYLKILLTFLLPSIFLSFRLIKRASRKKRSEWWHQRGLLPSTQSKLRAEERMLIQMKVGISRLVPSLFSVLALLIIKWSLSVPSSQAPLRESIFLLHNGE